MSSLLFVCILQDPDLSLIFPGLGRKLNVVEHESRPAMNGQRAWTLYFDIISPFQNAEMLHFDGKSTWPGEAHSFCASFRPISRLHFLSSPLLSTPLIRV